MADKVAGCLEVGRNATHEIVVNHSDLESDADGVGHIVFSINQARHLADVLLTHIAYAERERKWPEKDILPVIKIYSMNDCDWYAAATAEDAIRFMAKNLSFESTPEGIAEMREDYGVENPVELDDESMDQRMVVELPDGGECTISFRARLNQMIADGEEFPCSFASTEY